VNERLSTQEMAELSALADGTLPPERREEVEARVAASPELLELVERQRSAVTATHALAEDQPSASLVDSVEGLRSRRRPRARLVPHMALAGGLAVVAAVVAAVVLTGGPGAPTVADAARLANQPANAPPPLANSSTTLAAHVEGVAFPNLARRAGWKATGVRHGDIHGRAATVVFYSKDLRRIAYVIVSGSGLPRPMKNGPRYQTLRVDGRLVVTWERGGRTCVLVGDATRPELLRIASLPPY
jgi:anti-sigma factor RsiW